MANHRVQALTYSRWCENLLAMETLAVSIGKSGWIRWESSDGTQVYLRFLPDDRGRWVCREMMVDSTSGPAITSRSLANVPIQEIEASINADRESVDYLAMSLGHHVPAGGPPTGSNVAVLASHYTTTFGRQARREPNWCAAAQFSLDAPVPKRKRPKTSHSWADVRLTEPPGPDGLTDDFLKRVGRAYASAVARGEAPNQAIAADVTASPRTVERWVYESRRRGIMPPARTKGARG